MKYVLTFAVFILALTGASSCTSKPEPASATAQMVQGAKIDTVGQHSVFMARITSARLKSPGRLKQSSTTPKV